MQFGFFTITIGIIETTNYSHVAKKYKESKIMEQNHIASFYEVNKHNVLQDIYICRVLVDKVGVREI